LAAPYFRQEQYQILFARGYGLDARTITSSGAQTSLQVQIWDRHYDADSSDGLTALTFLEQASMNIYAQARALGLAMIPYHLMFARLKTMRPSIQLLSDGT